MIKGFEVAFDKVLGLSEHNGPVSVEQQSDAAPYALSPDERAIVREALVRTAQGGADEADVDATLRRVWG